MGLRQRTRLRFGRRWFRHRPRHCLLTQYHYTLEDLGSPYGTYVNGKRLGVREPERVTAADAIVLGTGGV
jgi:hypothetical protein